MLLTRGWILQTASIKEKNAKFRPPRSCRMLWLSKFQQSQGLQSMSLGSRKRLWMKYRRIHFFVLWGSFSLFGHFFFPFLEKCYEGLSYFSASDGFDGHGWMQRLRWLMGLSWTDEDAIAIIIVISGCVAWKGENLNATKMKWMPFTSRQLPFKPRGEGES